MSYTESTEFYKDRYAEVYDHLYAAKPYEAEAQWVHRLLVERLGATGTLLELACGTGRHAMEFAKAGWKVCASDCSDSMLSVARQRLEGITGTEVHRLDMREAGEFRGVPKNSCDAVVILFDSLGYVLSDEAIIRTLRGASTMLRSGGMLVCEIWHALPMISAHDPFRWRSLRLASSELIRLSQTRLSLPDPVAEVEYRLIELQDDGRHQSWSETQRNRFFTGSEATLLFQASGYTDIEVTPAYRSGDLTANDWHMLVAARRPETPMKDPTP